MTLAGALAGAAVLLVPGQSTAAAPEAAAAPAPVAGERIEAVRDANGKASGFRVVPARAGGQPGRYAYGTTDGMLRVQPAQADRGQPVKATTLRLAPARKSAAPVAREAPARAAGGTYSVRLQLANADHFGPLIHVWNRKTWVYYDVDEEQFDSYGRVSLPPGDYVTVGLFSNWQQPDHLITRTFSVKDRGLTVTLDANTAKETGITTDEPTARRSSSSVWIKTPNGDIAGFAGGWGNKVYVTPFSIPGMSLRVHDVLTKSGSGANNPSPYRYDLYRHYDGTVPASPLTRVLTADLAKTTTSLRAIGGTTTGWMLSAPETDTSGVYVGSTARVPSSVTEYATPGQSFHRLVNYDGGPSFSTEPRTLPKGSSPGERFGAAPLMVRAHEPSGTQLRGTKLSVYEPYAFSDSSGHGGVDSDATQDLLLTSNGSTVAEAKDLGFPKPWTATIPTARNPYRLVHTVRSHAAPSALSTRQTTEWAFIADGYNGTPFETDPPLVDVDVRVEGLDIRNTAGTASAPVTVEAVATSRTDGATATLTALEYSTDDGANWTALPVPDSADKATAELAVPQDTRYVSLRVSGKDTESSTVRRTVIRAFAGPAPAAAETRGATKITDVVVNGGRVIAPPVYDDLNAAPYTVRFTASDPAGIAEVGAVLHRGPYDRPDGVLRAGPATCTAKDATTSVCEAPFTINALTQLGRNSLAGEWKVAAWARSRDGRSYTDLNGLGSALILRQSRVTMSAPEQATKGKLFTVSGIAGISDWSTGRWLALSGQPVQLEYRKPGVSTWSLAAKRTADPSGIVKASPKAAFDANWRWLMPRTGEIGAAASPVWFIDVR
ncbi:hypothetical protein ABZ532_16010 [Streptomyces sp. NPDC019396]|uniref:hypothetical protein n=1 Tax=Streptomyces sp. NPDC019396 TaxID=3154687 RepID=UPI0033D66A11